VALQGTLDTFALPDVLRLLASTRKSGRLLVQGDDGNGSLYLDGGSVVGGETNLAPTDEGHEVLFELLRLGDGSFLFDPAENTPDPGAPAEVEDVIAKAESAHAEWQDLSTVVPSLDVGIELAEDLPDDDATIDRDRWRLIVGIGSGTTVRSLGDQLGMRELPILRATRGMVDDGLAVISDGSGRSGSRTASAALPTLDDEPEADDLFDDAASGTAEDLPEPLPGRSGSAKGSIADPFSEAADSDDAVGGASAPLATEEESELVAQMERLADEHRQLIDRAVEADTPEEAEEILDDLPEDTIDRDLMRRFLGSVRS
jgi:hypothetical protein